MTAQIVLGLVIAGLLARDFFSARASHAEQIEREREWSRERQTLLNRLESRNPGEFTAMERAMWAPPKRKDADEPRANGFAPGEHQVGI